MRNQDKSAEAPSTARESAARPFEAAYRQLFQLSAAGLALVGSDGRVRECNEALERMLGYTRSELSLMPLSDFTYPDDLAADLALFASVLAGERTEYRIEKKFIRKDGRILVGRLTVARSAEPRGDRAPVIAQLEDITSDRRVQEERRHLLHDLRERIKEATAIHEAATLILDDRLGIEGILQRIAALAPPAMQYPDVAVARASYGGLSAATPGFVEPAPHRMAMLSAPIRTRDGVAGALEIVYIEDRPMAAEGPFLVEERRLVDSLAEMISATLDRRVSDVALERSNQYLKLAQSAACIGVWDWDLKADRVTWSEELEEIAGIGKGSFPGTPAYFRSLVHPEDRALIDLAMRSAIDDPSRHDHFEAEFRLGRPDNTWRAIASSGRIFRDPDGTASRMLGMAHDITGLRDLERRLHESQKMDALGRLAGGVAHDFNNLLTVIRGYSDFLGATLPPDDERHADVAEIMGAADRAAALTRQLLAFSRQRVVAPRVVDPNVIVAGMQKLLERLIGADIEFRVNLTAPTARVRIDPAQLEQVLLNLVVNARDAMPEGGTLSVDIGSTHVDERMTWDRIELAPGSYVVISVSDSGTGMTEETKARLFEPFFTTKEPGHGTGLGLSTVYGIVKQSSGVIWVYTEPGHGSTFRVYLPFVADESAPAAEVSAAPVVLTGTETVLVVDDDAQVRAMAERALRAKGYTVHSAANGVQALAIVDEQQLRPDVLLSDIVMPRMQGPALATEILQRIPAARVLFMTGYTDRGIDPAAFPGPHGIVQKPFTPTELLRTVREMLDRATPPAS
jgi:PAS domain S-box-containing protein